MKETVKKIIGGIRADYKYKKNQRLYKKLTVSEAFSKIYRDKVWGKREGRKFYSGSGSHSPNVRKYINLLKSFIIENRCHRVVDLGCGDFSVMKEVLKDLHHIHYTGVDIVPDLIEHNQSEFGAPNIEFRCLDAIEDELPAGDLITIRQVLQHLSNEQISRILKKLNGFRCILITEHLPMNLRAQPNIDKAHGWNTRLSGSGSGFFPDQPPFNLVTKVILQYQEDLRSHRGKNIEAVMRTYLIENPTVKSAT